MRQIKFRGKRLDNAKWVYGDLTTKSISPRFRGDYCIFDGDCWHVVDPSTIGQYTGLKDCNDTEIYEGDIFKDSYYDWGNEKEIEYYIAVKWDEPSYGFIVSQSDYHDEVEMHHLAFNEIIGNVHDNPELINKQEQ